MKVTIREKLYDFTSDYPNGWQNTSGDYFKCPVVIGDIKCFIKRTEVKNPRDIPGWDLLLRLKHKNESNIARIYDIININERGKTVYYIFYEFLQGSSLQEKITAGTPVDLDRLVIEMFSAFESINKYDFWLTDFNEKNIFIEDSGRSVLLGLDSAQPTAKSPGKSIYGTKEYPSFVYKYYTEILSLADSGVLQIPGKALNYLQLIFLALRYKLAQNQPDQYSSPQILDGLPANLANIDPSFNELFNKIYDDGSYSLPSYSPGDIKDLIFQKIIYNKSLSPVLKQVPEIVSFKSSTLSVGNGETFTLNWQVKNASKLEIYKNGISVKKLNATVSSVSMNEFYDGKDKDIVYSLVATSEYGQSKPKPVVVKITDKVRSTSSEPVIVSFTSNTGLVDKDEMFTLNWDLRNATSAELYKNNRLLKKFTAEDSSFVTSEYYDGKDKDVEFSLVAYNAEGQSKRESLKVRITDMPLESADPQEVTDTGTTDEPSTPGHLSPEPPVIISFSSSSLSVSEGEKFTLEWEVGDATYLHIYKNGSLFKELDPASTTFQTTAYYNEQDDNLVYILLAGNEFSEIKSEPVLVELKALDVKPIGYLNPKVLKGYLFGALILVVLIVAGFIFYKNMPGTIEILEITPDTITEEHTIVLTGKNLPTDTSNVQVIFNNVPGRIVFSSKDIMRVTVPMLMDKLGDGNVAVALIFKGDTILTGKKLLVTRDVVNNIDSSIVRTDSIPETIMLDTPKTEIVKIQPKKARKDTQVIKETVTETPLVQAEEPKTPEPEKPTTLSELVKVSSSEFKTGSLGGVKDLTVTVKNDSKYDLENVKVSVTYKKRNEREIKDKTIDFPNIKAYSSVSLKLPDSRRGRNVSFAIVEISSRQFAADAKN